MNINFKLDHSITFIMIAFVIILFSSIQIFAQEKVENKNSEKENKTLSPNSTQSLGDKIEFKNEKGNPIITITDEGSDAGSITLPQSTPSSTTNKLYNEAGTLKFNGSAFGGGVDSINQLADAKYYGNSLFLGSQSGQMDDGTNNQNIGVGINALQNNIGGRFNTAFGFYSLLNNTTGEFNTASGYYSLNSNTTGIRNTAHGYRALEANTEADQNTAIGSFALNSNTTGSFNTAVGASTLTANITGTQNTAIGYSSLYNNTSGSYNVANGYFALRTNTTGEKNNANGYYALYSNTTGFANIANGYTAMTGNTTGSYNVGLGFYANSNNQEGSRNTIIGSFAGSGTSSHNKSGNVFLGYKAGYYETSDNKLYIQNDSSTLPLIWGDFTNGSELVKINGDFHVTGNITSDGAGGLVSEINDLTDAKYQNQSLFLGDLSGNLGSGSSNTAVGYAALNTGAGTENTSLGWKSMQLVTGANYSTAIGSQALLNESGNYNTAIGYKAIIAGTSTGTNNVAVGSNSLAGSANPISYNTAVGDLALNSNQVDANTAVGYSALTSNTTGINNTASGFESQFSNINGNKNTSLGNVSAYKNIDGNENVTIGYAANYWRNSGSRNTIIGTEAGQGDPGTSFTASGNVFLGFQAGYFETGDNKLYINNDNSASPLIWGNFTDGSEKVKINGEFETTGNITSLANQVAIGNNAISSGSASFAMGSNAQATASSAYALGNNATATSSSSIAIGTNSEANGNYSTAIGFNVEANGDFSKAIGSNVTVSAYGSMFLSDNSSGTIHTTTIDNIFNARFANGYKLFTSSDLSSGAQMLAGANSWSVVSDSTKKENFKQVNGEDVLSKISDFNLRSWNYKGQDPSKFRHYGPMAQEFYNAFGNDGIGTVGNDTTIASADFDGINLVAIQALENRTSEQNEIIRNLENRIKELEIKNKSLLIMNSEYKYLNEQIMNRLEKIEGSLNQNKYVKN